MIKLDGNAALVLVDFQIGFDDWEYWGGRRNNLHAEKRAGAILQAWRAAALPIFHIQHCSTNSESKLHESNTGHAFKAEVLPIAHEKIIQKKVNSAFIGTELESELRSARIKTVLIMGLTTDHCVSTTSRMAANLGFETVVIQDACATFDRIGFDGTTYAAELIHDTTIASLNREFATVINTADLKL
ncbi:MAG TPA: cysteine hydrolase family protein [Sphingobacteriaceae bacterium]